MNENHLTSVALSDSMFSSLDMANSQITHWTLACGFTSVGLAIVSWGASIVTVELHSPRSVQSVLGSCQQTQKHFQIICKISDSHCNWSNCKTCFHHIPSTFEHSQSHVHQCSSHRLSTSTFLSNIYLCVYLHHTAWEFMLLEIVQRPSAMSTWCQTQNRILSQHTIIHTTLHTSPYKITYHYNIKHVRI